MLSINGSVYVSRFTRIIKRHTRIIRKYARMIQQAVVRGTTNPVPCCHLANDTDLLTPVL